MAAADHDDVEARAFTRAASSSLFHVEQSLADAEAPNKRVEHIFDAGAPGDPVERAAAPGAAIRRRSAGPWRATRLAQCARARLDRASRCRALIATSPSRGRSAPRARSGVRSSASMPSPGLGRHGDVGAAARARPRSIFDVDQDRSPSAGASPASPEPKDQIGRLDARARARSTPIASTSSALVAQARPCRPAGTACRRSPTGASIRSRVVPAMAEVIAASRPTKLEKAGLSGIRRAGDDDPHAVAQPLRAGAASDATISAGRAPPARRARRRGQASPTSPSSEKSSTASSPRGKRQQPIAANPRSARLSDRPASARAARRCDFGLGLEQVGEALRLGEVDPAVLERAAGELARLGRRAGPSIRASASSTARDDRAAAVEVKLGDILAGRAGRSVEAQAPAPDRGRLAVGARARQLRHARLAAACPASALERRTRARPADPHHRDRGGRRCPTKARRSCQPSAPSCRSSPPASSFHIFMPASLIGPQAFIMSANISGVTARRSPRFCICST